MTDAKIEVPIKDDTVGINILDEYLGEMDWRVNENSNVSYSFSGLLLHAAGTVIAKYSLQHYDKKIARAHTNGDIHIHDLSMGIAGYCAGWSLRQLLEQGFNGVHGKVASKPPKHLTTALNQMVNFLGTMQNEWAGAMAFSSFDTYLAPFIRADNLSYEEVKQAVQSFVFNLNVSSRWGGQTPFTNITLDWTVPEDMKSQKIILGGKTQDQTYSEYQKEMDMINKAYLEVMIEGDMNGRVFTFPIPTYNITKEFAWETENAALLFEMTAKYGTPYFQNFVNSSLKPSDVRSMCCRLQMDLRELRSKTGGMFGSGESTGSIGVVTINMARIGYLAKTEGEFIERLSHLMDLSYQSLEQKRSIINNYLKMGLFPYTQKYLGTFNNHFATIGLNGMNEAIMNLFGAETTISSEKGHLFASRVLEFMRKKLQEYQEESGNLYNLEATPAEGTAYRFARKDKELFPDIITQGTSDPYYTNSTQLPVGQTDDIFDALDIQDELQTKYTGGTVFHGFLGEQIYDVEVCKKLVKKIAYGYKLPYFTLTPTFSVCPSQGYVAGEQTIDKNTGEACDIYSRVVGYFRPVNAWNKGKKAEFTDRKTFKVENIPSEQKNIQSWSDTPLKCVLVTTQTCPNCASAKAFLSTQDKLAFEIVNATEKDGLQFARQYQVSKVPTAILMSKNDEVVAKITGADEIKDYLGAI